MAKFLAGHPYGRVVLFHEIVHLNTVVERGFPLRAKDLIEALTTRDLHEKHERIAWGKQYHFLRKAYDEAALHEMELTLTSTRNLIERNKLEQKKQSGVAMSADETQRYYELLANSLLVHDLRDTLFSTEVEYVDQHVKSPYYQQVNAQVNFAQDVLKLTALGSIPVWIATVMHFLAH